MSSHSKGIEALIKVIWLDANIYTLKTYTQKHLKTNTGAHYRQFNNNIQMQVGAEYYLIHYIYITQNTTHCI